MDGNPLSLLAKQVSQTAAQCFVLEALVSRLLTEVVMVQDDRAEKLRDIRDMLKGMRNDIKRRFPSDSKDATEIIDRILGNLPEDVPS